MLRNKILLVLMLILTIVFPDIKQSVFNTNKLQDSYGEYYNSMIQKGALTEEEFAEFKARSDAYLKQEDSSLGTNVTNVLLITLLYYALFFSLIYYFIRSKDYFSSIVASVILFVFLFI